MPLPSLPSPPPSSPGPPAPPSPLLPLPSLLSPSPCPSPAALPRPAGTVASAASIFQAVMLSRVQVGRALRARPSVGIPFYPPPSTRLLSPPFYPPPSTHPLSPPSQPTLHLLETPLSPLLPSTFYLLPASFTPIHQTGALHGSLTLRVFKFQVSSLDARGSGFDAFWPSGAPLVAAAGRGSEHCCVWTSGEVQGPILDGFWPAGSPSSSPSSCWRRLSVYVGAPPRHRG